MSGEPGFAIALAPVPPATGMAWLFASSDGEVAQESDEIGGALFSHFWTTGLRGAADADGDGRVTLQESFDFAYAQTLPAIGAIGRGPPTGAGASRSHRGGAGGPHRARRPAGDAGAPRRSGRPLSGLRGGIADTRGRAVRSPGSPHRPGAAGRALPGAAAVRGGRRRHGGRPLSGSRARPGAGRLPSLRIRGSGTQERTGSAPLELYVERRRRGGNGDFLGDEAMLEIERRWRRFGVAARALAGRGEYGTLANDVYETSLGGEAGVVGIVPLGARVDLRVGVDARAVYIHQEVTRKDAAEVEAVGYPGTAWFNGSAWGGGLHADARYQLSSTFYALAAVKGLALTTGTDRGIEGRLSFGASLGDRRSF